MFEVRYTQADKSQVISLLFGIPIALWGIAEIASLNLTGQGLALKTARTVLGPVILMFGLATIMPALMEWKDSRVGKTACSFGHGGITWYGRVWWKLWRWKPVWHLNWAEITTITRTSGSVTFQPIWSKLIVSLLLLRNNSDAGEIAFNQVDESAQDIIKNLRQAAPELVFFNRHGKVED